MSEWTPVMSAAELAVLDPDETMAGYRAGLENAPEPGSDRSRSYWHGWRNGRVDGGHAQPDLAQQMVAREYLGYRRAN